MSESRFILQPLGDDVPEDSALLADLLRGVFGAIGISLRRYAARVHRNPGAVSRYLNGTRVPPWEFVTELFVEATKAQRKPLQPEVLELVKKAHRKALETSNKKQHEVQVLQDQLEEADVRVQQAAIREQVLMEGLQMREQRIAQLEVRQNELTARWESEVREREKLTAALTLSQDRDIAELARLKAEVEQLKEELREAQTASREAEERCQTLEVRLAEAEERAQAGREAREATELEEAHRAAAEAKAVADELRQQLEKISAEREATRGRMRLTKEELEKQFAEERERESQELANRDLDELLRDFLRLTAKGDESGLYKLTLAVARHASLEDIREIGLELWRRGYEIAADDLSGSVGGERDVQSVRQFVSLMFDENTSRSASALVERALSQFAWFRDAQDVLNLINELKGEELDTWVLHIQSECAIRRDPRLLAELLSQADDSTTEALLEEVITSRGVADIPPLLASMESAHLSEQVSTVVGLLAELRHREAESILEAWELTKE
ncbi:hypothetical protein ACPXCS_38285 [Streptomyces sp. DT190]|uniref:hypothetical protein n=1 Tax=unclassified Streptomyces TaxID=2593676 RepID=UPI003CEFEDAC